MHCRLLSFAAAVVALCVLTGGCSSLKDKEPFTQTVSYDDNGGKGPVTVKPEEIHGDSAFGQIQVVNDTVVERGFAIDELAVFETIPAGRSKTVNVQEAKNHHTYTFYDHKNPKDNVKGRMVIEYKAESER